MKVRPEILKIAEQIESRLRLLEKRCESRNYQLEKIHIDSCAYYIRSDSTKKQIIESLVIEEVEFVKEIKLTDNVRVSFDNVAENPTPYSEPVKEWYDAHALSDIKKKQ